MRRFQDRVAVVTGAAGGIGRALSEELARRGCHLALVDCDERDLAATAASLAGQDRRVSQYVVDIADRAQMEALPGEILERHGAVHLLVNNAGVALAGRLTEVSLDDLEWIVGINLWGVLYACKLFLPHLLRADEAHIVNIASDFALLGLPTKTGYCTTKFAVRGFSEALRAELHGSHVGLTCVYPGPVATRLIRAGRATDAAKQEAEARFIEQRAIPLETVVARILGGIERDAPRVLIGRETRAIDLMKRLCPDLTDRLVARLQGRVRFL